MLVQAISMIDLSKRKPDPTADELILDVRTTEEFREGHLPGSRNIPHDQLTPHLEELRAYRLIFIHCRSGKRAATAAQVLHSAGLTNLVCVSNSGMPDWIAAGLPVEKS